MPAGQIAERLADAAAASLPAAAVDAASLDDAVSGLREEFDPRAGGFGGAPKFPPSMVLEFLLRHHERTGSATALAHGRPATAERDGPRRHVRPARRRFRPLQRRRAVGGAALREDALRQRAAAAGLRPPAPGHRRTPGVARGRRDRRVPAARPRHRRRAASPSALDADTEGVEGKTYAWTPAQLVDALGAEDGAWAAQLLAVTEAGTFEHGASTLQLVADPDDPARWERVRAALLAARAARPQPARDDKVVTAWNGLAIVALAEGGAALDRPAWVTPPRAPPISCLDRHIVDGRLRRSSRDGAVGAAAGVLEDHAALADGLLALPPGHRDAALARRPRPSCSTSRSRISSTATGAFFDTADDAEALLHRPREITDNAAPVR